ARGAGTGSPAPVGTGRTPPCRRRRRSRPRVGSTRRPRASCSATSTVRSVRRSSTRRWCSRPTHRSTTRSAAGPRAPPSSGNEERSMPRVGVAQFRGSVDREDNIAAVARLAARAADVGVDLLGFHELANTIYVPIAEDRRLFALAEPDDGPSITAARAAARKHRLVLVYPFFEVSGARYYNTAVVLGPDGEKIGR